MQAGIIDKDMPISASAVAIVCPTDGPTRIGYRFDDQGRKVRFCRKCGGELPKRND
jgi:large subunit ribosomal protein L24